MIYAVIAIVILLVVVFVVVFARKPKEEALPEGGGKKLAESPRSARPGEAKAPQEAGAPPSRPEPKSVGEKARPGEPSAAAAEPEKVPAVPARDVSTLRKGLAKARGET